MHNNRSRQQGVQKAWDKMVESVRFFLFFSPLSSLLLFCWRYSCRHPPHGHHHLDTYKSPRLAFISNIIISSSMNTIDINIAAIMIIIIITIMMSVTQGRQNRAGSARKTKQTNFRPSKCWPVGIAGSGLRWLGTAWAYNGDDESQSETARGEWPLVITRW